MTPSKSRLQLGDKLVKDAFLHKHAGTGAADLSLIEEDACRHTFHRLFQITVIKNHVGRFAAEFQSDRNQFIYSCLVYAAADFSRACECQLIEIRIRSRIHCPDFEPAPGTTFSTPAGSTSAISLASSMRDRDVWEDGLITICIACRQRRSKLPAGHKEWEIPGQQSCPTTPIGLNASITRDIRIVVEHRRRAFLRTDAACEITEMVRPHRNIHRPGFTNRLTVVQRFDKSQMLSILINNIRAIFRRVTLSFNGRSSCARIPRARRAAFTARSTSSRVASAKDASTSPLAGLWASRVLPSEVGTGACNVFKPLSSLNLSNT